MERDGWTVIMVLDYDDEETMWRYAMQYVEA
jgi:hypothetical protein